MAACSSFIPSVLVAPRVRPKIEWLASPGHRLDGCWPIPLILERLRWSRSSSRAAPIGICFVVKNRAQWVQAVMYALHRCIAGRCWRGPCLSSPPRGRFPKSWCFGGSLRRHVPRFSESCFANCASSARAGLEEASLPFPNHATLRTVLFSTPQAFDLMQLRERLAYSIADLAAVISPFWRFRLWTRLVGGDPYRTEDSASATRRKIKPHGYEMELFESDWMERYALRSGYFYQDELTALIEETVSPGDVFIDIGANVGFVSLIASSRVGARGQVFSFEPNPGLVNRLKQTITRNRVANVSIFETALGENVGTVRLIAGEHHGTNQILIGDEAPSEKEVPLRRADDLLRGHIPDGVPAFMMIDVEGAELGVLKGMPLLLQRPNTRFFVEVGDEHSKRFGSTAEDIFRLFTDLGYTAYFVRLAPLSPRIKLNPAHAPKPSGLTYDVFFCKESLRQPNGRL